MYKTLIISAATLTALAGCSDSDKRSTPVNTPPEFSSSMLNLNVAENSSAAGTIAATDADGDTVSLSLSGVDSALFSLQSNGSLVFNASPDFESPSDSNADNQFEVTVGADDGAGGTADQEVVITVTNINEAPQATSMVDASVEENSSGLIYQAAASDPESDALTFELATSADFSQFNLAQTGELTFVSAPDFETPTDSNTDNRYELVIAASDGVNTTQWNVSIEVTDLTPAFAEFDVSSTNSPRQVLVSWTLTDEPVDLDSLWLTTTQSGQSAIDATELDASVGTAVTEFPILTTDLANTQLVIEARDIGDRAILSSAQLTLADLIDDVDLIGYAKADTIDVSDQFGRAVAISDDGLTMVIGAPEEDSAAISGPDDNSVSNAGSAYVLSRIDGVWQQTARLKADNADVDDRFGELVAISADGSLIVVGAVGEDGANGGVNNLGTDNTSDSAGAAYIFELVNDAWRQHAYLKAQLPVAGANFGSSVAISGNGESVLVGAENENSATGAAYHFQLLGDLWVAGDRLAPVTPQAFSVFGNQVALDFDGSHAIVAARSFDTVFNEGALYAFTTDAPPVSAPIRGAPELMTTAQPDQWRLTGQILAPNADERDALGYSIALDDDGSTLVASAVFEDSAPGAVFPNPVEDANATIGATYVFMRDQDVWTFDSVLKPNAAVANDRWGESVAISSDGSKIAISSIFESSSGSGVIDETNASSPSTGSVVLFENNGSGWNQEQTLKSSNPFRDNQFGISIDLNSSGDTLVVGSSHEDGSATGVSTGVADDNATTNSGAVYYY